MKPILHLAAALLAGATAAAGAQTRPCSTPEFRQFDFWLGHWEVINQRGEPDGSADIVPAPGGCGFFEYRRFESGDLGVAFNLYDPSRGRWTQLWQAPGNVVRLEGRWQDGALRTEGSIAMGGQPERPFRVIWTPVGREVRQEFFLGGPEGWRSWFTSTYRRAQR